MLRLSLSLFLAFLALAGCATEPAVLTTPAEITITTPGTTSHSITRGHSAYAFASDRGNTVVFTDAAPGTDCQEVKSFTARWTFAGTTPADMTWQLEMPDGGGSSGPFASAVSLDVDVIETGMSGHFANEPSILDGKEVTVGGTFDAQFCPPTS